MAKTPFGEEIRYIELHPTNKCIFRCHFCTYLQAAEHERGTLSVTDVSRVLDLKPTYILLCGGGDPTSYCTEQNGRTWKLPDLLSHIQGQLNAATIHIGTHGGCRPLSDDLLDSLVSCDHIGISLGASYEASRGPCIGNATWDRHAFERTLSNIHAIVTRRSSQNKRTYVSSMFTRDDWVRLFGLAYALFQRLGANGADAYQSEITFGVTSVADDSRPTDPYYASRLEPEDRHNWGLVRQLIAEINPSFSEFIRKRTKLDTAPEDRTPTYGITKCGMVQDYVLAAADGHYYPCCVMAARRSCSLGTIADTLPKSLRENREAFYASGTPGICQEGCRVKSHTLMGQKAWPHNGGK